MRPTPGQDMVILKPYSKQELADLYGIGIKTFKKWLQPFKHEIGLQCGRYYTVLQVRIIFRRLGLPNRTISFPETAPDTDLEHPTLL